MTRAEIIANPATDAEFVGTIRDLARRDRSPHVFQADLRTRYPAAVVRHSDISGRDGQRWYVYRDGSWAGDATEPVASIDSEEA